MKQICRMDKTNKRPYCLRKPCSFRLDGSCSGAVVAEAGYYSLYNCPAITALTTPTPARRPIAASTRNVHIAGIENVMYSKERGSYELRSFVCRKESVKIVQYGD